MASRDWSTFKKEEVQLMQLRQRAKRLKIGVAVFLGMAVAFVVMALISVLCFKQPWAGLLFVPATLCLFCFAHCLLMGHNNVWPDLRSATDAQRFYYSVLKRQEWRDNNESTIIPCWEVRDRWEGQKHFYALDDGSGADLAWEFPLEWKNPGTLREG